MSSLGLVQLERYDYFLNRRKEIIMKYNNGFKDINIQILDHYSDINNSSGHLYITRVLNADHDLRNHIISGMASKGISCNVHYKPLPLMTAYIKLGYNIVDYPNAYNFYSNEISLPLHTLLTDSDIDYIIENFKKLVNENV
jgi:dTDP-4-amino-4,6-dideoxygalactose transaminase